MPGWSLTYSGRSGSGSSKPITPGSLTPSLKPKCSFPRRVPGSVAPFCWKTITILACAAASRWAVNASWSPSAVSEATVITACTVWPLPSPNSQFSGELSPVSPSERLWDPSLNASRVPPFRTEGRGSLPPMRTLRPS